MHHILEVIKCVRNKGSPGPRGANAGGGTRGEYRCRAYEKHLRVMGMISV